MSNRIEGKTALITGASSGIGEACAHELAAMEVNLILLGRNEEKLNALQEALHVKVTTLCIDVRESAALRAMLEAVLCDHNIDILINNAGLALGLEPLDAGDTAQWDEMIDVNIKALLHVSRIILPHFKARNSGHVINIGSIAGRTTYPNGNVYCATKAAVHALSESMNVDMLGTNVRVSNVAPGAVKTHFSNTRFSGDDAKADAVYEGYEPLSAEDIADLIVYILNAPLHVNIQDTLIMPTAQRNPYMLSREQR